MNLASACTAGSPAQNNLGGLGPDSGAQEIRYARIAILNGALVDLVVRAVSAYTSASASARNGCNTGNNQGQIHVNSDTSVKLEFSFQSGGNPVTMPAFQFSILDADQFHSGQAIEAVTATGYTRYMLSDPTEITVSGNTFTSTEWGIGNDNPLDPLVMTETQRRRTVIFLYETTSSFRVTMAVTGGNNGRNFFFAGMTDVSRCPLSFTTLLPQTLQPQLSGLAPCSLQ